MLGEPLDDGALSPRKPVRPEGLPSFLREPDASFAIAAALRQGAREGETRLRHADSSFGRWASRMRRASSRTGMAVAGAPCRSRALPMPCNGNEIIQIRGFGMRCGGSARRWRTTPPPPPLCPGLPELPLSSLCAERTNRSQGRRSCYGYRSLGRRAPALLAAVHSPRGWRTGRSQADRDIGMILPQDLFLERDCLPDEALRPVQALRSCATTAAEIVQRPRANSIVPGAESIEDRFTQMHPHLGFLRPVREARRPPRSGRRPPALPWRRRVLPRR